MGRSTLVLALAGLASGCPRIDLEGLRFACSTNRDCEPDRLCDPIDRLCVPPERVRRPPEPIPTHQAYGELLGLGTGEGEIVYWYASGAMSSRPGSPDQHQGREDDFPAFGFDLRADPAEVVAIVLTGRDRALTFTRDGLLSSGPPEAPDRDPSGTFVVGEGSAPADVAALAVAPDGSTVGWLHDGSVRFGTFEDLSSIGSAPARFPLGKGARDLDAAVVDAAGGAWAIYRDGTVSRGAVEALDAQVWPGPLAGMTVSIEPNTYLFYRTGWLKVLESRLIDSFSPQQEPWSGDWATSRILRQGRFQLPSERTARDVVGMAMGTAATTGVHAFFRDGQRFYGETPDRITVASPTRLTVEQAELVVDVALTREDRLATFLSIGRVRIGSVTEPFGVTNWPITMPEGVEMADVAAVGGEDEITRTSTVGAYWILFRDGSISEGRSFNFAGQSTDRGYLPIAP